jgi:hypothetical protein
VRLATGYGARLELRSVVSGRVTRLVARLGGSWTNNGLALSPDGGYVYLTLIPKSGGWKSLLLERISTSTGRRRLVGRGEQPALSPDGRLLAYAAGEDRSASIVVRDLSSGAARSINLARLLGGRTDMLNASLAWLGDGRQVAVFEACCATLTAVRHRSQAAGYAPRLIVVSMSRDGGVTARRVLGPGANEMPLSVATDTARANSILVSSLIPGDRTAVDRLTLAYSRATLGRVLTIAHGQVLAFGPTARTLLYLVGHRPPDLWTATINDRRLVHRRLLIRNSNLDAVAW